MAQTQTNPMAYLLGQLLPPYGDLEHLMTLQTLSELAYSLQKPS